VKVLGPVEEVAHHLEEVPADEVIIAIPSAGADTLKRLHRLIDAGGISNIRILPNMAQVIESRPHVIQTRNIDPQDILGRSPVTIALKKSLAYLRGKRVLITGAGGSIGGELSRQLLSGGAQRLYLFDHEETGLHEIQKELKLLQDAGVGEAATVVPVVGDLKDRDYMHFIIGRLKADVVFHCAAYKHVPMLEANPIEAIKNNVFGTKHLVDAAIAHGVSRFVLISTDKAVDPVCVYGASKMLAEEIVLHASRDDARFMVVRFGNVLDSRGSIVPLFRRQIAAGGPVTLTDPRATRFFMTMPESASLVLKAGGVGEGGVLYILDMGEPVLIRELAEQMIRFYGFEPGKEIRLEYIGLRPGERLTESLYSADEIPVPTTYPGIRRLIRKPRFNGDLAHLLDCLTPVCFLDPAHAPEYRNRRKLRSCLASFIPSVEIPEHEPEY
jgi:FlaA1/EpsC-like NDP-sugar epimerase